MVRDHGWQSNAEIHIEAILQLLCRARGHFITSPCHVLFSSDLDCTNRALFDTLLRRLVDDDPMYVDSRRMDFIRIKLTDLNNDFYLGDSDLASHRDIRIEIASRLAIDKIAGLVCFISLDQRHVGNQRALHHVLLSIEFANFLPFRNDSADTGLGKKGGYTGTAGTQFLV